MGTPSLVTAAAKEPKEAGAASRTKIRTDIEGLRAIAVVSVVAYHLHAPGFTGGFSGVDVFFVISGYLVTSRLASDAVAGRGVGFREFYARRIRRILPVASLAIVVTIALTARLRSPIQVAQSLGPDARSAALIFSNFRFEALSTRYLAEQGQRSVFLQFWSLSVEEQFYLLWPAVLFVLVLLARRLREPAFRLIASGLFLIVVVSLSLSIRYSSEQPIAAFFLLPYRAWELAAGALLAVGSAAIGRLTPQLRALLAGTGLAAIGFAVVRYDETTRWPGLAAAVPVAGTAMVIASGTDGAAPVVDRVLAARPVQAVGRFSYSIYLWHWPLVLFIAEPNDFGAGPGAAVVALALTLAALSYYLVEHPVRRSPWLRARPNATFALGAALILVSTGVSFVPGAFIVLDAGRPSGATPHRSGDPPVATEFVPSDLTPRLVDDPNRVDANTEKKHPCWDPGDCVFGDPSGAVRVVLFGDSHSSHWTPAIEGLAARSGWRFDRLSQGGCSSFALPDGAGLESESCREWLTLRWQDIDRMRPDLLILSNASGPAIVHDRGAWERGIAAAVRRAPAGTSVAVFSDTPVAEALVPECLADHLEDSAACEPAWPSPRTQGINERIAAISTEAGAKFIDLTPLLCTADRCPAIAGNILVYRDDSHLTTQFVTSRTEDIGALLGPVGR